MTSRLLSMLRIILLFSTDVQIIWVGTGIKRGHFLDILSECLIYSVAVKSECDSQLYNFQMQVWNVGPSLHTLDVNKKSLYN